MDRKDISIFLTDDDEIFRKICRLNLNHLGYEKITDTSDGHELMGLLNLYKPHLVLMDSEMPGLDGYEVCKEIRNIYSETFAIGGMSNKTSFNQMWLDSKADFFLDKALVSEGDVLDRTIRDSLIKYFNVNF